MKKISIIFILSQIFFSGIVLAHQSSHSQISLTQSGKVLQGEWYISVDDLQRSEGLDTNADGTISWGEIHQHKALISSLAKVHIKVEQDEMSCDLRSGDIMLDKISTGIYVVLPITLVCPNEIKHLNINYDFLFAFDAQHKAILKLQFNESVQSIVFSKNSRLFKYNSNESSKIQTLIDFIVEGVWHIWIGFDHILFLLSLLLPAALVYRQKNWHEQLSIKVTALNTIKIVTAFTVAHSLTLMLSVFDWVFIPSQIVESIIAVSVIVAALNNIKPVIHQRLWVLTFIFGLLHGFGFASVLNDVGLPQGLEWVALFGFNLGVELGQLTIVAVTLPIIILLSKVRFYRKMGLQMGSIGIAVLASIWLFERVNDISILS